MDSRFGQDSPKDWWIVSLGSISFVAYSNIIPMGRNIRLRRRQVKKASNIKRVRRVHIYGREIRTTLKLTDIGSIVSGSVSSPYGWVYGREIDFTASNIFPNLPPNTREVRVLSAQLEITMYLYPDDGISSISGKTSAIKGSGNNYWPDRWDTSATQTNDHPTKWWSAVCLQDRDGDINDTFKFNHLAEVRAYVKKSEFKYGTESSIHRHTVRWSPQEPSENEWIGNKASGNSSRLFKVYALCSHLLPSGWASPSNTGKSRKIAVDVFGYITVVHRGIRTTVACSLQPASPSLPFEILNLESDSRSFE